jgi:hypothetical protein
MEKEQAYQILESSSSEVDNLSYYQPGMGFGILVTPEQLRKAKEAQKNFEKRKEEKKNKRPPKPPSRPNARFGRMAIGNT